ncbi:hypothetical protein [Streptomyces typhae]|uniref:hypothetical protein n=1 Tax=Streptomyces typhae TaxID=2681492 RepID=UPI0018DFAB43|nr:hypothetical protein [Streptomyces typhae]
MSGPHATPETPRTAQTPDTPWTPENPENPCTPETPNNSDTTEDGHCLPLIVRGLLAGARLPADEHQFAGLVTAYAAQRPALDALYDLPEARHALPVLRRDVQADGPVA